MPESRSISIIPSAFWGDHSAGISVLRQESIDTAKKLTMEQLRTCRAKSVDQYAESIRVAVCVDTQEQYLDILNERLGELSAAQQRQVKKLIKVL